ncbi:hypothetical protein SFRURICE_003080, partial [Spodoptera frugiperda]
MGFCVKCYNKLPTTILNLNEKKFKSCIKRELCKQAYYKLSDYIEDKNAWQHKHYFKISNDGVSCSFFSIRSYTLERAPSFTDRQTDGQFNLTFQ